MKKGYRSLNLQPSKKTRYEKTYALKANETLHFVDNT